MAVQACVNRKMIHDDEEDDDDVPIVFKRRDLASRLNSELRNISSSDKLMEKQVSGTHASHDHSSSIPKGKVVQPSRPHPVQKSPAALSGKVSPLKLPPPPTSSNSALCCPSKDSAVKEEKPVTSDFEDDKPLSSRLSLGSAKNKANLEKKGVESSSRLPQSAKSEGISDEESDDNKFLSEKLPVPSNAAASSSKIYGSSDDKALASKALQTVSIKRENLVNKHPVLHVKRPGDDAVGGQSSVKKVKFSGVSVSAKAGQISMKAEPDDENDHILISQRMKKPTLEKKTVPVKRKIVKVPSSSTKDKKEN